MAVGATELAKERVELHVTDKECDSFFQLIEPFDESKYLEALEEHGSPLLKFAMES